MKKITALILVCLMSMTVLASCDKEEPYFNPYNDLTLEEIASYLEFADSYKGIAIKQTDINKAWESDYESQKKALLKAYREDHEEGGIVKKGDILNISYSGILEGETEPFEGGTGTKSDLEIGSGAFIEGFEDGLIGKKIGEKVTLNLTFPKDYIDEKKDAEQAKKLNGKKVTFTVEVKSGKTHPDFNDEFIKKAFKDNDDTFYNYETVAEYEEAARKNIYAQLAFEAYKKAVRVKSYPTDIHEEEYNTLIDQYRDTANAYGYTLEAFVKMYGYKTVEDFSKAMMSQSADSVKNSLLLYYVYNANKAEIDGMVADNKDRILNEYAEAAGYAIEDILEEVDPAILDDIVINSLVNEFIGANCTVVDDVVPTPTPTPTPTVTPTATATPDAAKTEEK